MKNKKLEISVFVSGFVVMVFEIVGSRVLVPYLGTSIFVWTSLIGVILGSLSFGYYFGGKLADKKTSFKIFSLIIFLAGISIYLMTVLRLPVLIFLRKFFLGIRSSSFFSSLFLFFPASFFLGMVTPYAVKLKMKDLKKTGKTVGNLYAISTLGSIAGTFLAGFYLIPFLGTSKTLYILAGILIVLSLFLSLNIKIKEKIYFLFLIILTLFFHNYFKSFLNEDFIDIDTFYNRVWIYDFTDSLTGKKARAMVIANENSSASFLDNNDLVYEYLKYYNLAQHFNPGFQKTLLFGGAAYSWPKYFLEKYSKATIDVVEIDPGITEIAKKYFRLKNNPRMRIFHEDGRSFLNRTTEKYDVIFGDAFNSHYSIPFQLTTKEAVEKYYHILNNKGIMIVNIASAVEGKKGKFLRAEYKTFKEVFPQVFVFPVQYPKQGEIFQNIILIALKCDCCVTLKSDDKKLNQYLNHLWQKKIDDDLPILTDDYAPVDYYINQNF